MKIRLYAYDDKSYVVVADGELIMDVRCGYLDQQIISMLILKSNANIELTVTGNDRLQEMVQQEITRHAQGRQEQAQSILRGP